jgi:hypothetical protein
MSENSLHVISMLVFVSLLFVLAVETPTLKAYNPQWLVICALLLAYGYIERKRGEGK